MNNKKGDTPMKKTLLIIALLLTFVLTGCNKKEDIIDISKNGYAEKPVFLIFKSDTCSACMEQKPIWDKVTKEYKDSIVFKEIDIQDPKMMDFTNMFEVKSTPTIISLDKYSNISYYETGVHTEEDLKHIFDQILEQAEVIDTIGNTLPNE